MRVKTDSLLRHSRSPGVEGTTRAHLALLLIPCLNPCLHHSLSGRWSSGPHWWGAHSFRGQLLRPWTSLTFRKVPLTLSWNWLSCSAPTGLSSMSWLTQNTIIPLLHMALWTSISIFYFSWFLSSRLSISRSSSYSSWDGCQTPLLIWSWNIQVYLYKSPTVWGQT